MRNSQHAGSSGPGCMVRAPGSWVCWVHQVLGARVQWIQGQLGPRVQGPPGPWVHWVLRFRVRRVQGPPGVTLRVAVLQGAGGVQRGAAGKGGGGGGAEARRGAAAPRLLRQGAVGGQVSSRWGRVGVRWGKGSGWVSVFFRA